MRIPHIYEWLLPGEEIKMEDSDLRLVYSTDERIAGKAYVTNYRLRFEPEPRSNDWGIPLADALLKHPHRARGDMEVHTDSVGVEKEDLECQQRGDSVSTQETSFNHQKMVYVTLGSISKVEKWGHSKVNVMDELDLYGLLIVCKDTRNLILEYSRATHGRRRMYETLRRFAFPHTNKMPFFATLYAQRYPPGYIDGWNLFDGEREFSRQQIFKQHWSITRINENYEFAPTYPSMLAVPTEANHDKLLRAVGDFRSKKRIPVLSWLDHRTGAAIVRSAQPLVGVRAKKSEPDEEYLKMIKRANTSSSRRQLSILDARPTLNAKTNRLLGGGYEAYTACELSFLDIENIHVVRKSQKAVKHICYPEVKIQTFKQRLERSKWSSHLQSILEGSIKVVMEVAHHQNSTLVHCSDGWDRTAQITSLAMVQLDPYYRTIEGFAVLIEKEWCSFGHKFAHRFGHGEDKHGDKERAPIFVQFIDCVWQLFNHFPSNFEFNSLFLKTILDEVYACRFGTFLYNSERERRDLDVRKKTVSLWTHMLQNRELFTNEKYIKPSSREDPLDQRLDTVNQPLAVLFWSEYYCQYNLAMPELADMEALTTPSTPLSCPISAPSSCNGTVSSFPLGSHSFHLHSQPGSPWSPVGDMNDVQRRHNQEMLWPQRQMAFFDPHKGGEPPMGLDSSPSTSNEDYPTTRRGKIIYDICTRV